MLASTSLAGRDPSATGRTRNQRKGMSLGQFASPPCADLLARYLPTPIGGSENRSERSKQWQLRSQLVTNGMMGSGCTLSARWLSRGAMRRAGTRSALLVLYQRAGHHWSFG